MPVSTARIVGHAETVALKTMELIRVYVWLDPARGPDGRYLNLTRISFVNTWNGKTTADGILVVYRDGRSKLVNLNIKLRAGEEKTYLPSKLGISGMNSYPQAPAALKCVQAHTSLGNDFVSVWGRPDRPALYVVGTTRTDTYNVTRTTTLVATRPTTTTITTTSYTATTVNTLGPTTMITEACAFCLGPLQCAYCPQP